MSVTPGKKRTGRPLVSCAPCRRSKLRCDRMVPCGQCSKKGRTYLCSQGSPPPEDWPAASSQPCTAHHIYNHGQSSVPRESLHHATALDAAPGTSPIGQLSIDVTGRSRFFGPTAAAHVLQVEQGEPSVTRIRANSISFRRTGWKAFPLGGGAGTSPQLLREGLPAWSEWQRMKQIYWQASCWRYEPITPTHLAGVVSAVYGNAVHPDAKALYDNSPSHLAVCYMILAIACLFDPQIPNHDPKAEEYSQLAIECLGEARFLANVSVESLVSLHLYCCYLINCDRPRTDEIYVLVGLGVRMAMIAGFHRDGQWWGLEESQRDARRRIWWEMLTLERINSNRFGSPPSLQPFQFDTLRPADQPNDSFLFWRWEWDDVLHARLEDIQTSKASQMDTILAGDAAMRDFWDRLPIHLKSPRVVSYRNLGDIPPSASTYAPTQPPFDVTLALQQARLALHFNTGLLQLHRAAFGTAINTSPENPLVTQQGASVTCISNEVGPNIVSLLEHLTELSPIIFRHVVLWLDLFSCLVPLAALIIRCPRTPLAINCHHLMLRGLTLLEQAYASVPCEWHRLLWDRGRKLGTEATSQLAKRWEPPARDAISGESVSNHLPSEVQPSDGLNTTLSAMEPIPDGEFDFDRWLESLKGDCTDFSVGF